MIANVMFFAKDIDDALLKLGNHFKKVAKHGTDVPVLFAAGKFQLGEMKDPPASPEVPQNEAQGTIKPLHARLYLPNGKLAGNGHI